MVEQEFKDNQTFRYPEEYDIYKVADEKPKKLLAKPTGKKAGLHMPDYSAGEKDLEVFKRSDALDQQKVKEKRIIKNKALREFDEAMIEQAQLYLDDANDRMN